MDLNDISNQKKLIEMAKSNYDFFVDSQHNCNEKCTHVGFWLKRHSSHLLGETNPKKSGFIVFHPGSLIRVDFGVNIGSEITGSHFAVVLNKKDSEYNPILTVVPLTSKIKKQNIDVGLEVFDRVIEDCKKTEMQLQEDKKEFTFIYDIVKSINELDDDNPSLDGLMIKFFNFLSSKYDEKFNLEEFKKLSIEDQSIYTETLIDKYMKHIDNVSDKIKNLNKVTETYTNKYRNNTYVDISQITTISKYRIMSRINEYDPMCAIQVKDSILKQIRDELSTRIL